MSEYLHPPLVISLWRGTPAQHRVWHVCHREVRGFSPIVDRKQPWSERVEDHFDNVWRQA